MIQGRNIVLIEARHEDMPAITQIAKDCADRLFFDGGAISIDRLGAILAATEPGTSSLIWSAWKNVEIVGFITLNDINPIHRSAEIRFLGIKQSAENSWLFSDIGKAVWRFAFMQLNLNRIYFKNFARHEPINALYRRAKVVLEGTQKQARWCNGKYEDLNEWAILADDWRKNHHVLRSTG